MTDLTTDTPRTYGMVSDEHINMLPVAATTDIFEGMAVATDAGGDIVPADGTLDFAGFALKRADNDPGADADISCKVAQRGRIKLTLVAIGLGDVEATVYASDSNVFTLASTGNNAIGKISQVIDAAAETAWVYFEALAVRSV